MSAIRNHLRVMIIGLTVGGLAAVATPQPAESAKTCKCDDEGTGEYQCNYEQTQCVAGDEACMLTCA